MNFSSSIFLYIFMPSFILLYLFVNWLSNHINLLRKSRTADIVVILESLVFYMWACFDNVFFLLFLIVATWIVGKIISKTKTQSVRQFFKSMLSFISDMQFGKLIMVLAAAGAVVLLYQFKYKGEIGINLFDIKNMATPIGISFLTFSVISYIVDVYKGAPAGTFIDVALYLSFFPKVISGPIVLWENFLLKLSERSVSVENTEKGILRIIYGLAKKVVLADYFGSVILQIETNNLQLGGYHY